MNYSEVSCLGHRCHNRDSNPHSAKQKHQRLSSVLLFASTTTPYKGDYLETTLIREISNLFFRTWKDWFIFRERSAESERVGRSVNVTVCNIQWRMHLGDATITRICACTQSYRFVCSSYCSSIIPFFQRIPLWGSGSTKNILV